MTELEATVLRLLARGRERHGLELERESDGVLKRGTIYVLLGRMVEKGLVVSRVEEKNPTAAGLPRRFYKSTEYGRRALAHHLRAPKP